MKPLVSKRAAIARRTAGIRTDAELNEIGDPPMITASLRQITCPIRNCPITALLHLPGARLAGA